MGQGEQNHRGHSEEDSARMVSRVRDGERPRSIGCLSRLPKAERTLTVPITSHRKIVGQVLVLCKRFLLKVAWRILGNEVVQREERLLSVLEEHRLFIQELEHAVHRIERLQSSGVCGAQPLVPQSTFLQPYREKLRGDESLIVSMSRGYVDFFVGHEPVLDLGCGRGTFLELLKEEKIDSYGVDTDHQAVKRCKDRRLRAEVGDAPAHLRGLARETLGGIFCSHILEHLSGDQIEDILMLSYNRLKPGGRILVETPDPSSLLVLSTDFYKDPTHLRPLHSEGLKSLMEVVGFENVTCRGTWPFSPEDRLPAAPPDAPGYMKQLIDRLNGHLCQYRSYVVTAVKPN